MKNNFRMWPIFCIFAPLITACDDGRLYGEEMESREEGFSAELTGSFGGTDRWAQGYSVVLAGFAPQSEYAVITKALPLADTTGAMRLTLNGIPSEVEQLRLCAVNRLRESVADFVVWTVETPPAAGDTLRLQAGELKVSMYRALQQELFDRSCIACHGAGERPAAGLSLMQGESHAQLVGMPSTVEPTSLRVEAGQAEASVLYRMVATGMSREMGIDHSDMVPQQSTQRTLLKEWINDGAKHE